MHSAKRDKRNSSRARPSPEVRAQHKCAKRKKKKGVVRDVYWMWSSGMEECREGISLVEARWDKLRECLYWQ